MKQLQVETREAFAVELERHEQVIVDFSKDNCPGCRMLEQSLKKLAEDERAAEVTLLNVKLEDVGEDFFREFGLRQTPTLVMFREGAEVARAPGFQSPTQLTNLLTSHFATVVAD